MSSLPTVAAPAQNGPPALGVKRAISLEPGAADEEDGGSISTKKSRMVYRLNHPEGAARVVAIATQMLGCRFKAQGGGTVNVFHHGYQKKAAEETMLLINEGKPLQADAPTPGSHCSICTCNLHGKQSHSPATERLRQVSFLSCVVCALPERVLILI